MADDNNTVLDNPVQDDGAGGGTTPPAQTPPSTDSEKKYTDADVNNISKKNSEKAVNKVLIELFLDYAHPVSLPYHYQKRVWQNLQIISGTTLGTGGYYNDGFFNSRALKVVDCHVLIDNNTNFFKQLFGNTALEKAPDLYADNGKGWESGLYFQNCYQLRDGGRFHGAVLVGTAFQNCYNLEKVSFSAECSGFNTSTFSGCVRLKDLTVDEGFSASLYIHHSTQYPAEVLHAIIENYADCTGFETAPTFQVGSTNLEKIDDEHKAMLETKNVNYL